MGIVAADKDGRGHFFAIDRRAWAKVCGLGMNAAVAYLVLARGSGGDNRTTSWSTHAIETHTGIGRPRARQAIAALVAASLVRRDKGGTKPRYHINAEPDKPDWIWLPNTIIDGAAGEVASVERIRQSQNPAALRLFGDLYHAHALAEEGGINWREPHGLRLQFERKRVGVCGPYYVWGFQRAVENIWLSTPPAPFVVPHIAPPKHENRCEPFWAALRVLKHLGLVQYVAHLVEGDGREAEVIHPLPERTDGCGEMGEHAIAAAAFEAAEFMVTEGQIKQAENDGFDTLVPVHRHIENVQLVGIARLRHRPRTAATAIWYSKAAEWAEWAERYQEMGGAGASQRAHATSR